MLLAVVAAASFVSGCIANDNADDVLAAAPCAVLSGIASSSTVSISGNLKSGNLDSYSFSQDSSSNTVVTPPSASACGDEIAQRLQGLCATCQNSGEAACINLTETLFDIKKTPVEACAVCGDDACSPGESARSEDAGYCPQDCTAGCGDGACNGLENVSCEGRDPAECVACPVDCGNACGNDICDPGEGFIAIPERNLIACPQDCADPCGDAQCTSGENPQPRTAENPLGCPQDCSACPDNYCTPDIENAITCPQDCATCGDTICSEGAENLSSCPQDCATCGDNICTQPATGTVKEDAINCPRDCTALCGDQLCSHDEVEATCARDCPGCGDGMCDAASETNATCAYDCP